ncbi:unnamed protein product [Lactuca saligna]|uniref:PUB 62/63 C-terminal domain-containing protein n=1 Tax=Lactuca saligna TaxID=75948 RepID=A0AA36A290_LACSI|nr:unnamed protein product [Lactuca saligna]
MKMASEDTGLVLSHRIDNKHPQLLFQDDPNSSFRCNPPNQRPGSGPDRPAAGATSNNNGKATRELTGFIDHQHRYFQPESTTEFRQSMYNPGSVGIQNWHGGNGRASDSRSGDGSDGNEDEDDVEGLVNSSDNKNNNSSNTSAQSSEKEGNAKLNHLSSFGSSREVPKAGSVIPSRNDLNDARPSSSDNHHHHHQGQTNDYPNAVAVVDRDSDLYYSQYLHGAEGSGTGLKDMLVENGCGFSGRKDSESGDSLRTILSDPLTGSLMDDAMILRCGHSFGSGGMQHIMKIACYTCSHPVVEGSVASNLSLRAAVSAFRREEESQVHHSSKRRRERSDQDRVNYGDSMFMDTPRGKGLQFPFAVADRVIIKGNKRTPERFVGCEAVVTTQCLNGWYVVKTLDNAESIKVQYRSLAKVSDNSSSQQTSRNGTLIQVVRPSAILVTSNTTTKTNTKHEPVVVYQ